MLKRLRELRDEKGYSQEDIGKVLGVTKQTIFAYEKGTASPSTEALVKIAEHFNVTVDYLLGLSDVRKYNVPLTFADNEDLARERDKQLSELGILFANEKFTMKDKRKLLKDINDIFWDIVEEQEEKKDEKKE